MWGRQRYVVPLCICSCPMLEEFWREVGQELQKILLMNIGPEPKFFLLGLHPTGHWIKGRKQKFMDICLLQANRVTVLSWKSTDKPSTAQWFREFSECLPLGKNNILKDKIILMFQEVLGCFTRYTKNNDLSHILKESGDEESVLLLFLLYFCCFFLFFVCFYVLSLVRSICLLYCLASVFCNVSFVCLYVSKRKINKHIVEKKILRFFSRAKFWFYKSNEKNEVVSHLKILP